ncbi:MAG: hypothetical protein M0Z61_02075 [Nitrospiraceae bacterium]|nr:hypothetical protein [Nitrospiraceae bacterium]
MKLINPINNERGLTLVIVMVLSVVALLIMSALIYMVQAGTEISGMQKRYATALDAGMGGLSMEKQIIDTLGIPGFQAGFPFQFSAEGNACTTAKMTLPTGSWPASCSNSITLNPNDNPNSNNASYDMVATLGNYKVYAKIVDTIPGNTGQAAGLVKTGVVSTGDITVQAMPYIYTLAVLSMGNNNSQERSKLSAVYQY